MAGMDPVPARLELALSPTPILKLERVSRELGPEIYVKRDDLTGLLESGNKVRKLEFLVGEALAQGADTLIACGTAQSNCCRAVAAVAARLGLRACLALLGERPSAYDGNLLLARLLGADVRYLSEAEFSHAGEVSDGMADEVRADGGIPYVIPESGAGEVGALGYLECAVELAGQMSHGAPRFDTVVVPAFSGTTQAGLLMGKQLVGLPSEIVGVPIDRSADQVTEQVAATIERAIRRFGFAIDVPKGIHLLDGYQGDGRDPSSGDLSTVAQLASSEGLVLDPVYGARAFGGLVDSLERDAKAFGQRICFVHTGGLFSLFPLRDRLSALADAPFRPRD